MKYKVKAWPSCRIKDGTQYRVQANLKRGELTGFKKFLRSSRSLNDWELVVEGKAPGNVTMLVYEKTFLGVEDFTSWANKSGLAIYEIRDNNSIKRKLGEARGKRGRPRKN